MGKSLHKKIILVSVIVFIISLVGTAICYKFSFLETATQGLILSGFSFFSILSSYAIEYQEKKWIRICARYSVILLPFLVVIFSFFPFNLYNTLGFFILVIILILVTLLALVHIFLYTDSTSITGTIILLALVIIGIFLKRNRMPFSNYVITSSSILLSSGYFMYAIRCLFLVDKIAYLKNVSFFGSCIISIAFLGQMFKLQHWPGARWMLTISFASMIVGTIFILLTLHSSGFIDWQPKHRKILKRLLFPWTLIFVLFIFRFMLPDLDARIWSPDKKINKNSFGMTDYPITNKNGLNSE